MDSEQAKALLNRYAEGRCSPEESAQVAAWYHRVAKQQGDPASDADYAVGYVQAFERLQQALPSSQRQRRPKRLLRWLPYAAAILLVGTAAVWIFFGEQVENRQAAIVTVEDIAPGGNRATLTLADGRTITLDEARDGIVVGSGEITYNDGNPLAEVEGNEERQVAIPLLELSTPKGGTYQIILPDGTRVWLNAATTLKYPSRFEGEERVIELEGEAYFDVVQVRKDVNSPRRPAEVSQNVPFKVVTNSQTIEVLGTEFNISAYADDAEARTTLVEGLVRVAQTTGHQSPITISPGQQAITRGSSLEVNEVDVFDYTAWRDGVMVLNGARLADVMRQVERWYDVAIEVPALKTDKTAYVIINRNENLSSVLKALEETYQVKLKLEGRRVGVIE